MIMRIIINLHVNSSMGFALFKFKMNYDRHFPKKKISISFKITAGIYFQWGYVISSTERDVFSLIINSQMHPHNNTLKTPGSV